MIRVAIVEDQPDAAAQLNKCLDHYEQQMSEQFSRIVYQDAEKFLFDYHSQYDLVFMDIEMPGMDGMQAAYKLREIDQVVALVFVTNLSRYAINGYEVGALDYILKPLVNEAFVLKMRKVVAYCHRITREETHTISIPTDKGEIRMPVHDLYYVEISAHDLIYHTAQGNYSTYGTMKKVEAVLTPMNFFRCNSCYLVNMQHVRGVEGYEVLVEQERLVISHPKKRAFVDALVRYNA